MTPEDLQELAAEFLAESREHADLLERSLLELELAPEDTAAIGEAFRAIHSIKGTASLLGLLPFEALGHAGEVVLARVVRGARRVDQGMVAALRELAAALRELFAALARDGEPAHARDGEAGELIEAVLVGLKPWMDDEDGAQVRRIVAEQRELGYK